MCTLCVCDYVLRFVQGRKCGVEEDFEVEVGFVEAQTLRQSGSLLTAGCNCRGVQ